MRNVEALIPFTSKFRHSDVR